MPSPVVASALAVAFLMIPKPTTARTWMILPDGSGDAPTIQAGIDSSAAGDTVLVGCGTYFEHDIEMKSGICLRGEMGDSACAVVDAQGLGRVMICDGLVGATTIEGLTITGGVNPLGDPDPNGAGLYCRNSSPIITGCLFDDNFCSYHNGGGLLCTDGSAPLVTNCRFTNNSAGNAGGGMYCTDSSVAVVQNCEFSENFASWWAGGLACSDYSDISVSGCLFYRNNSNHWAAGFAAMRRSLPTVSFCLFLENLAAQRGGAVGGYRTAMPLFENCTFYGNSSPSASQILARDSARVNLENCIVAYGHQGATATTMGYNASIVLSCCDVFGNAGGDWVGVIAGQDSVNGNLWADPEFCDAADGVFTVASTSPCLNPPGCGLVGAFGQGCALPPRNLWYVRPDGSGDAPTIRAALDSADHGDTLVLADGLFSGPGNRDLDCDGKRLVIYSESGDPKACVIDCGGSATDPHSGFLFYSEVQKTGSLRGVRITNGYASGSYPRNVGGALHVQGYTFAIKDCIFEGNRSANGGAVYARRADLSVAGCRFTGNEASQGSAMGVSVCSYRTLEVTECEFVYNGSSSSGKAVEVYDTDGVFTRCRFEGNIGGGVRVEALGYTPDFVECSFVNNTSPNGGGGAEVLLDINLWDPPCTFTRCLFRGNSAASGGAVQAGIFFYDDVNPGSPALVLDECTLYGNTAAEGAGLYCMAIYGWMEIRSTIIAFNHVGEAAWVSGYPYPCPEVTCSDLYGNEGGDWTGCISGLPGSDGNISEDPLFCDAQNADLTLDAASACLNEPGCGQIGAFGQGCDVATDVADEGRAIPNRPFLSQNVPNPFNPATTIRFGLPKSEEVSVTVHDIAGRRVATLAQGPYRAGEFVEGWDGRDDTGRKVGSGIYFARMQAGGFTATRKMLFMR